MNAERWEQIKTIVTAALEMPVGERAVFVKETCGADLNLLKEVESLLVFDNQNEKDIFDKNRLASILSLEEKIASGFIGKQIGKYRIVREIGAGGMSVVFLAERTDGEFEQQVAIKFLRHGFFSKFALTRFLQERQILARLQHRFIAQLYDGGTTSDGTPYLVMEYVEGEPVTRYAEENNLSLHERLRLFRKICEAVSFAHRNLIVHRDLKPDNILINREGIPKLLDFGIAKLLSGESEVKATVTRRQAFTPEYASPEQIIGESITTASDIYVLGIILYELLTGEHPFCREKMSSEQIRRAINQSQPPRPSRAIAECGVRSAELKTDSAELVKRQIKSSEHKTIPHSALRIPHSKDLDNIVLKALRREPERRYQSVEQLAEDLRRYEEGLPIMARPATFFYQAQKFYQRNKITVFAGLLVLLSLVAGLAMAIWQANVAREQAEIAAAAQKRAEEEAAKSRAESEKARKISDFTQKILSYANPAWYAEGASTKGEAKVIDVVNALSDKIDVEFAGQPDVQAELHHRFTDIYLAIGREKKGGNFSAEFLVRKALFHAERALALRKQFYGERHELVAKDLYYLYTAKHITGDPTNEAMFQQAIEMMRETNPRNANLPFMLEDYGSQFGNNLENWELAENYYRQAMILFRDQYGEDNHNFVRINCNLAIMQLRQGEYAEAEPHYKVCKQAKDKLADYLQTEEIKGLFTKMEQINAAN